jgi:hypothetical protein
MDRHRLVEARAVVAVAEEDELAEVLLSGVVFERSHSRKLHGPKRELSLGR